MENLNIRITAQSQDAQSAIDEVNEELGALTATAEVADDQMDELNRSFRSTGAAATQAAAGMGVLGTASAALHTPLLTLAGLSVTAKVALAGLVGVVGGLAVALSAVGLAAFAAGGERLKTAFAGAAEEIDKVAGAFGEPFVETFVAGIRALPEFIGRILDAIGQEDARQFAILLSQAGETAMEVFPPLVGILSDFAEVLVPPMVAFLRVLERAAPLLDFIAFVVGGIADGIRAVANLLGPFFEFANVLLVILDHLRAIQDAIENLDRTLLDAFQFFGADFGPTVRGAVRGNVTDTATTTGTSGRIQPPGPAVYIEQVTANSQAEGQAAAEGIRKDLNRELRAETGLPYSQRGG